MLKNIIYIKIIIWKLYIIDKYVVTCKDDTSNEFVIRSIITFTSASSSCSLLYAALIYASNHV